MFITTIYWLIVDKKMGIKYIMTVGISPLVNFPMFPPPLVNLESALPSFRKQGNSQSFRSFNLVE
jgi:hypothetical protein